ncbi:MULTISPECIES: NmrA family NAD(P)-binding protein [unclassified Rhodococcus (in: high G+C Gram-positive bacteria)]|uniref:NmrA family NAD(P)-binding protein n=1 Tax=unclassified Rhodococcus (in: high G+C Gram-positive bacteria) TaxID=192944 RepID=UPI000B9ADFAC|nr:MULTISPECIES: NmrA family NAD(P)-binding protein [unclassified Rhodococcus (in: high G+C Gram-positive bacteria)]OZE36142.1 nmra family transcriptional regulator [Rhodococcus sp. 05-2254-4]OZE41219.1 nmra family transcriptional regulator [Rhodococcus sp. 05-2254-3]OZE44566.1 nmra family transcriptional regulator [Rhodococcus sp. 05-2254-2]
MELDVSRGTDIAIVGATGKTGRAVAAALDGVAVVRRLSRSAPDYPVDLETGAGLVEAFTGCRGVYFIAPNVHPDEPALLSRTLDAAASAGVDHLVYHSVAWPYSPRMPHHMDKARCEEELRAFGSERGLHWTILQPCAYAQNFEAVLTGSPSLVVPYSLDTKFSFVSLDDVAEVAARILVEGAERHHGATYELGGPEMLSVRDVVRLVEALTGRAVSVESIGVDEWIRVHGTELNPDAQQRLSAMFEYYNDRDFLASSAVTATLLGRSPTPIRALVR